MVDAAVRNEQEIDGVVTPAGATRSGDDVRRRGWFWHWNSIVTQYAPVIGLKGVGLLNSYTVWTDRREESPTRGYAFPSQQSEADFYGEDRAELITINKLLVALDLIEIRKEMVLRTDEQGRRWKVPHNFYRVKDHGDGSSLTSQDVLRVAELADRDQAVYRYVRRMFSPRFSPIDTNNVWHGILTEVREQDVWQRLAARAQRDEQRASDRTRAGHAARKGGSTTPGIGDTAASPKARNDSAGVARQMGTQTSVAMINKGSDPDVGLGNNGSTSESTTVVAQSSDDDATSVGPTNRTYHQRRSTTTTTATEPNFDTASSRDTAVDSPGEPSHRVVTDARSAVTGIAGNGPGILAAPGDAPAEADALRAFEAANGRRATPAERQLLQGLAERFDPAAREQKGSGWSWLSAAAYEAVDAGSGYVAPRRLREILSRWEREGMPSGDGVGSTDRERQARASDDGPSGDSRTSAPGIVLGEAEDFSLPHGFGSRRTWEFTVSLLSRALEPERLRELVEGTAIAGYGDGEVTILAPDARQAEWMSGEYRELIARKLGEAMRRPVRIAVLVSPGSGEPGGAQAALHPAPEQPRSLTAPDAEPVVPVFLVVECGLPSPQVWAAVLDEIAASGAVSPANMDAWLRNTRLIGRQPDGALVIGAAHSLAQQRIATRFGRSLQDAVSRLLGRETPLEIVVARDWLLTGSATPHEDVGKESGAA
jgi:hypothetical protein